MVYIKITKYIGEQFGKPTGIGGKLSTFVMNRMNQKQYKATIDALKLCEDQTVLDIGFGNGYLLKQLSKRAACRFYGIEISGDILSVAARRNKSSMVKGRMQLSIGDVVNLSFEDEVFDKIYSVNTIYFWSSADKGLSEIKRVLKPGGMFVNTVYSKEFLESWSYTKYGFVKYTLDELKNLAVNHGFTLDIVTVVKDKSYCFVLRKPITADR